ncbi:MAG: cytochrome c oxidase accessory protein CcoG [Campylobacterales bacterium]|nr:cytochrome c oxidase accessory protein CcoG [Campylobacterales bacterium]
MNYTTKRYIFFVLISLLTLIAPFIVINGNHMLLLSFEKLQFHFLWFSFDVGNFYLMPFLLMFVFIGIFAMTTMFGRVWCGWACPQTIFRVLYRDFIEGTLLDLRTIKNKQKEVKYNSFVKVLKQGIGYTLWGVITVIVAINFIWYFVPPEDFFAYMTKPEEHLFMIGFIGVFAGILFLEIVFVKENFCAYVCPYVRVQSVLYDSDTKHVIYDESRGGKIYQGDNKLISNIKQWTANEECTTCEACVKVCPTGIDIRKGLQLECINCLECADACSVVMGKKDKKSLISWGSINFVTHKIKKSIFTRKNVLYMIALVTSLFLAFYFGMDKDPVMLNINKTTQLYKVRENGKIENDYVLTIKNSQRKDYTYVLKLEDENFQIKRFRSFKLKSGKLVKKVLVISSDIQPKDLTKLKLTIFAKEDKTISLTKELVFISPKK